MSPNNWDTNVSQDTNKEPNTRYYDFNQLSQIWRNVCGGNGVSVLPYAHSQKLVKVQKHLIYVCYGCGMQSQRFYGLNHLKDVDRSVL